MTLACLRNDCGMGVRVLVRGAWGFAAISEPTRHDACIAARRAVDLARAAAVFRERRVELAEQLANRSIHRSPVRRDPLAVPIEDKIALLLEIDAKLRSKKLIRIAMGSLSACRDRKIYVNSEGSEIDQELVYMGVGYRAGASDGNDMQFASHPAGDGGIVVSQGWEMLSSLPVLEAAEAVAESAIEQLRAAPYPSMTTTLIRATRSRGGPRIVYARPRLDRVLDASRSSSGGGSCAPISSARSTRQRAVNIYADARRIGAGGAFAFDDEGVEAQRIDPSRVESSPAFCRAETARRGLEHSRMRADGWAHAPALRCTSSFLEPSGSGTVDDLVADTKSGIFMDGVRGVSFDERAQAFRAHCGTAWRIENGRRVERLKNPSYGASLARFWRSCDAIAGESGRVLAGCAIDAGDRFMAFGYSAPAARFSGVDVGISGRTRRCVCVGSGHACATRDRRPHAAIAPIGSP